MPRNSKDFVGFIARHFPVVDALCRQPAQFRSDDEIIAFLRPFETDQKSLTRLMARIREGGVLIDLAADWGCSKLSVPQPSAECGMVAG